MDAFVKGRERLNYGLLKDRVLAGSLHKIQPPKEKCVITALDVRYVCRKRSKEVQMLELAGRCRCESIEILSLI